MSSEGAYYCYGDKTGRVPGVKTTVVDTNGAGDSFWGGFLYKVSTSGKRPDELSLETLAEYVRFGNAVASLCVEGRGAIPAMPDLLQVEKRLSL